MQSKTSNHLGATGAPFKSSEAVREGCPTEFGSNLSVTVSLRREHDDIKRMLKILVNFCAQLDRHDPIRVDDLERILDFLKIYVDGRHNGKEEGLLYPELESGGGDREKKMIGRVLHEHETERMYVSVIGQIIRHYRDAKPNADTWLVVNLSKYISLQKAHIEKENTILFTLAENRFSERRKADLLGAFASADENGFGAVRYDEFQALLTYLEKNYKMILPDYH